jgi:predicted transcriptional regulator
MSAEDEVKLYQRIVGCIPTQRIVESLKSGEKSLKDLTEELNKLSPEGLNSLVTELYVIQLKAEGIIEETKKGGDIYFRLTDKWKNIEAKKKSS